jgi:uncharacterized protein YlbG (UPF0298 family)
MNKKLYKPFKSLSKYKKYSVYVLDKKNNPKLIHFGDMKYQHYKDKIGEYKHLDHLDEKRRINYLKRAKGLKDKYGELTYNNKNSPNYWSINYLW